MSVQGKCSIVKIVDNKIVVNEINTRLLTSSNWDSYQYLFIDNVNLQKTPWDLEGVLICIIYNDFCIDLFGSFFKIGKTSIDV